MLMAIYEVTNKKRFCGTFILIIIIGSVVLLSYSIRNVESAGEWWNINWHFRKQITIDQVDSALNNFPVLISLTDSNLASKAQADGDDIVFTDALRKKLNHEVELFNGLSGQLVAWVQADLSSTTDTTLYMYYGNPEATNQQNGSGTWDSYFVMVQHLEETSNPVTDSTAYHNDGTYTGSGQDVAGKIDGADYFRGKGTPPPQDHIAVPHSNSLNFGTGSFTISVWVKFANNPSADYDILRKGCTTNQPPSPANYKMEVLGNKLSANLHRDDRSDATVTSSGSYGDDSWHFVVFQRETQTMRLYVDASLIGSAGSADHDMTNGANMSIGSKDTYNDDFYAGTIDEVEVSTTARSVAWIKASYDQANGNLVVYGAEEAYTTIKSCNSVGTDKDTFTVGQTVYVYGSGYPQAKTYNLYIVNDVNDWSQVTNIPADVRGAPTTVQTDSSGQIIPKPSTPPAIWTPTSVGQYDIIVDVNNDGKYNAGIDAVDGLDIGTTGLFVIPEYTLGTILAIAMCFAGVTVYKKFRHNRLKTL
jgi:hypothetical protein